MCCPIVSGYVFRLLGFICRVVKREQFGARFFESRSNGLGLRVGGPQYAPHSTIDVLKDGHRLSRVVFFDERLRQDCAMGGAVRVGRSGSGRLPSCGRERDRVASMASGAVGGRAATLARVQNQPPMNRRRTVSHPHEHRIRIYA